MLLPVHSALDVPECDTVPVIEGTTVRPIGPMLPMGRMLPLGHKGVVHRLLGRWRTAAHVVAMSGAIWLAAGCSTTASLPAHVPETANGTITGFAGACVPPMTPVEYEHVPVSVLLVRHGRTIGWQTVKGTHTFVFHVPPGTTAYD